MADSIKVNFKMIRDMEKVKCIMLMDQNILETGIMANRTVMVKSMKELN